MAIQHDLPLVSTIAVGLSLAFLFGLIASKLRIPPIVGFLLAGVVIGPYTPGYVADLPLAEQLAEIGIVLLMFGVGLHFSLKDLMSVKKIAIPGAVVQIGASTLMGGLLTHYLWGWSWTSGMLFGLILSTASTVVLLRALEENNILQSVNGRIAIGWLIVEDLAMVLALVMIPALAQANLGTGDGGSPLEQLAIAILKVAMFVAIMLIGGKRFLPWLLQVVAATRSRELFTLAVFAVAVGIAFGSAKLFNVSFALGAFFAGMMIRESKLSHEVAERALPFQDAFAVLFFVAVGMLFHPQVLWEKPLEVLMTTLIIIIGKSLAAFMIVWLLRYPLKTSLLVSAALAQIGEFSFILISLGLAYELLPVEARDLVLAGAMISIALNPLTFYAARRAYSYVERNKHISAMFNMRDDDLSHLRGDEKSSLRDLVILVGYGRVGKHIFQNIHDAHIDLVVIDNNREIVEILRGKGAHAIAGDATFEDTLTEAAIGKAVAVVVAVPDPFEARQIVEAARKLRPGIKILVRARDDEEMSYFAEQNVDLALTGPREVGRRMTQYLNDMRNQGHAH